MIQNHYVSSGENKQSPSWLEDLGETLQTTPKEFSKYHIVTGRYDPSSSGKYILDLRAPPVLIVLGNECVVHLFSQCGVAWRVKRVTLGSSWMGPFHDFVKDARWQIILIYEQHELKLMWTHVQLAWWWHLVWRRDRDIICIMGYTPNVVLGWVVVEFMSIQLSPLKKTFESS